MVLRAGDRVRWTRNNASRSLIVVPKAVVNRDRLGCNVGFVCMFI